MRRAALAFSVALGACAPDADMGTEDHVYLQEPRTTAGPMEAGMGADAAPQPAPTVASFGPSTGEYGTELVIAGEGLGSSLRSGVSVTLSGDDTVTIEPGGAEVVSWTESEIRIHFPFPLGPSDVTVSTPEGTAVAGSFTPSWTPGSPLANRGAGATVGSVATGAGRLAVLFGGSPLWLVETDGATWTQADIAVTGAQAETARLYLDEQSALSGFILSNASPPEILSLTETAGTWSASPTGITVSAEFAVAGGSDGATVWYRDSAGDWYRARPTAGTWSVDLGPLADPAPSASRHAAAATSGGGLVIGYAKSTGDLFDDRGAPFVRALDVGTLAFASEVRAGLDVDDAVDSLEMTGRGGGVLLTYVGDEPGSDFHVGSRPALGPSHTRTPPESSTARYAFNAGVDAPPGITHCSDVLGTRRVPAITSNRRLESDLDQENGESLTWPCGSVLGVEFDDSGDLLVLVDFEGEMYLPRPR